MDPERQWIARLEPETPEQRESELNEARRGPVVRFIWGAALVAYAGGALISFLDEDLAILRPLLIMATALVSLTLGLLERRTKKSGREALRRFASG